MTGLEWSGSKLVYRRFPRQRELKCRRAVIRATGMTLAPGTERYQTVAAHFGVVFRQHAIAERQTL